MNVYVGGITWNDSTFIVYVNVYAGGITWNDSTFIVYVNGNL
jgi:hypothetical protein